MERLDEQQRQQVFEVQEPAAPLPRFSAPSRYAMGIDQWRSPLCVVVAFNPAADGTRRHVRQASGVA